MQLAREVLKLLDQFRKGSLFDWGLDGRHPVIRTQGQLRFFAQDSPCCPGPPLLAVPGWLRAQSPGGRDPEQAGSRKTHKPEPASLRTLAPAENLLKPLFRGAFDACSPALGSQAMAAAMAAALEDVLPVCRPHADAKPVGFAALAVVWLKGPFHGANSTLPSGKSGATRYHLPQRLLGRASAAGPPIGPLNGPPDGPEGLPHLNSAPRQAAPHGP